MQKSTLISPSAVSYNEILDDIVQFVDSQPDAKKWRDFFAGGNGLTFLELCAGLSTFLNYNALATRRESYLYTAKLRRSIYGIADTLGYPINRKTASRLTLTVNNISGSNIFWERTDVLGFLSGRPLSLIDTFTFPPGTSTVDVIAGEWASDSQTSTTDADYATISFDLLDTDIDQIDNELLELYIDNAQIEYSRFVEDIDKGLVIQKSLLDRIDMLFGSSSLGRKISPNQNIEIRYVVVAEDPITPNQSLLPANVSMSDNRFTVSSLTLVTPTYPEDSIEKVVALAPGYFTTRRRMVTDFDHESIAKSYTGIIDAKFHPGQCMIRSVPPTHQQATFTIATGNSSGGDETVTVHNVVTTVADGTSVNDTAAAIAATDYSSNINIDSVTALAATVTIVYSEVAEDLTPDVVLSGPSITTTGAPSITVPWDAGSGYDDPALAPFVPTREDCEALLGEYESTLWESGIVGCCTVSISYLFDDEHVMITGSEEEELYLQYLDRFRLRGAGITFKAPEIVEVYPQITVVIEEGTNTAELQTKIRAFTETMTRQLGGFFHSASITSYADSLPGVIRTYIVKPLEDKQLVYYKYFKLGSFSINFTTNPNAINQYGSGDGGNGYSE